MALIHHIQCLLLVANILEVLCNFEVNFICHLSNLCNLYVKRVSIRVETRGPLLASSRGSCPPWFLFAFICFETGSLVGLRVSDLGRLADQQAQGIIWFHPPGLGLLECATHPAFYVGSGD